MKKTFFAALVAVIAILATSCKTDANAPKVLFTFENNGRVVTFVNASIGADSYEWNFGDGTDISTEVCPVHTYAENGKYTIVLKAKNSFAEDQYSQNIILVEPNILIDGDFSDWDAVIDDSTAVHTALEADKDYYADAIKQFAAYMDPDYIYFMLAYDPANVMPLDLYLGCSGEQLYDKPCTHLWSPMYCDYLIKFGKGDSFVQETSDINLYDWTYNTLFTVKKETNGWVYNPIAQNICTVSNKVTKNFYVYLEGKMARANFNLTVPYVYISCCTSNESLVESGTAPAAELVESTPLYPPQLKLTEASEE